MNKKGFTLIELLAVIVILAVIALIATPVIMNAISNAKQGAWKDAAYGIIKATENAFAKGFSETTDQLDTFFLYENGVMTSYPAGKTIDYKGSVPQDGGIVLHSDGSVTLAIHDGSNCAVKTKSAGTVTVSSTDKATCVSNIYYKQATAPFSNALTNGDFSNGITGWSPYGSTLSSSNGSLFATGNGSGVFVLAGQTTSLTTQQGRKYYVNAEMKSNSSLVSLMYIELYSASTWLGDTRISNPVANKSYIVSGLITNSSASTSNLRIQATQMYGNVNDANGRKLEVRNIILIDLTTSFTAGNEPTQTQMDNNLNKVWIDSSTNTPKRFTAGGWVNF